MGINKLWADLRQAKLIDEIVGKENEPGLAAEVDGLVVAVDVSIWMFQVNPRCSRRMHHNGRIAFELPRRCQKAQYFVTYQII